MEENNPLIIHIRLGKSHQGIGDIIGQNKLSKGRRFHDVVKYTVGLSVGVLSKE